MPNKPVKIKSAFTLEEIEDGIGSKEEELYTVNFQGKKIIVPWWADTLVVDRLNNLVAFPGIPIMVARQTDNWFWRSTDCEGFQVHGLVVGEVEIEEGRGCTPLDGILISLSLFDQVLVGTESDLSFGEQSDKGRDTHGVYDYLSQDFMSRCAVREVDRHLFIIGDVATNDFWYDWADEAGLFSGTKYNTLNAARDALNRYIAHIEEEK